MSTPRRPDNSPQLGNEEPGGAHWPLDLELHPDREDETDEPTPDTAKRQDKSKRPSH